MIAITLFLSASSNNFLTCSPDTTDISKISQECKSMMLLYGVGTMFQSLENTIGAAGDMSDEMKAEIEKGCARMDDVVDAQWPAIEQSMKGNPDVMGFETFFTKDCFKRLFSLICDTLKADKDMSQAGTCAIDAAQQFYGFGIDNEIVDNIEKCVVDAWALYSDDDENKFTEAVATCTEKQFTQLTTGINDASCLQKYPELVNTVATCAGDKLDSDEGLGVLVQGVQQRIAEVENLDFPKLPKEAQEAAKKVLDTETQKVEKDNKENLASLQKELKDATGGSTTNTTKTGGELATYSAVALYAGLAFSALAVLA